MRRYMDSVLEQAWRGELPPPEKGGPLVYGWSLRLSPRPDLEPQMSSEPMREPLTDVIEGEKTVTVTAEMPGVEKSDIDLETDGKSLTIRVERVDRKYHKELALPCRVKPGSPRATCKNGVLEVVLERAEEKRRGKKVKVH
ncbi:MAG: Hsp20/alpha crystallin family protein [Euryarchaeota archaeon]|nr:Hsp20/alpha crystallin family protein [Euryarchaeota archaeon]